MTALTIDMKTIIDRAYQTALEDEFKTTVTTHDTDEGAVWVQREGMPLVQVYADPFGEGSRCTCGWFKLVGYCSHIVSAEMTRDLWRQEAEHEAAEDGAAFLAYCKADREMAAAFDGGDYLSDPFSA